MMQSYHNCVKIKSNQNETRWSLGFYNRQKKINFASEFIYESKEAAIEDAGNYIRFQSLMMSEIFFYRSFQVVL